jgi:hypothetical protein
MKRRKIRERPGGKSPRLGFAPSDYARSSRDSGRQSFAAATFAVWQIVQGFGAAIYLKSICSYALIAMAPALHDLTRDEVNVAVALSGACDVSISGFRLF